MRIIWSSPEEQEEAALALRLAESALWNQATSRLGDSERFLEAMGHRHRVETLRRIVEGEEGDPSLYEGENDK